MPIHQPQNRGAAGVGRTASAAQLVKDEKRIVELDTIISRIYEDHVAGKLTNERFSKMLGGYENEQTTLFEEAAALRERISTEKEKSDSIEKFLRLCATFTDLTELTAEIARTLIEKVIVYEAVKAPGHKWKKLSQARQST